MKVVNYFIVNLFLLYQRFKTKMNRRVSRNISKITSSDISLTLSDQGAEPPLFLLHRITQGASAIDPLIRHLKSYFRIVALDCRGHGQNAKPKKIKNYERSMAGDIESLLAQLSRPNSVTSAMNHASQIPVCYDILFGWLGWQPNGVSSTAILHNSNRHFFSMLLMGSSASQHYSFFRKDSVTKG